MAESADAPVPYLPATTRVHAPVVSDCESDLSTLTDLSSELSSAPSSPKLSLLFTESYPTPDCSQTQSTYSSSSEQGCRKRRRTDDEFPPVKKRKTAEPKERITVHIDLKSASRTLATEQSSQVELLLKVLRKRRKIIVVAGAGISTSAGGKHGMQSSFGLGLII